MRPHDHDLDEAIDRVARVMTEAAPAPDFARRVHARIDAAAPPRKPWTTPTLAAAAIVVAALAAGIVWMRGHRNPTPTATEATRLAQPPAAVAAAAAARAPADAVAATPARKVTAAPAFKSSVPELPPLDRLEAITQDSIQPTRLTIPPLTVEAIVVPPVDGDGSIR